MGDPMWVFFMFYIFVNINIKCKQLVQSVSISFFKAQNVMQKNAKKKKLLIYVSSA